MAPPNKFARLNQIDPESLGNKVQEHVEEHVASICLQLGIEWHNEPAVPQLVFSVKTLASYAMRGGYLDAPVEEYLISIAPPVWSRAADEGTFHTAEFDDADPDKLVPGNWLDELVLVMRSAIAREKLEQGESVSPAELAMLASMAGDAIRLLCSRGEIAATKDGGWLIASEEAKRFLELRRVKSAIDETETVKLEPR